MMIFAVVWVTGGDGLCHAIPSREQDGQPRVSLCLYSMPSESKPTKSPTGQPCDVCINAAGLPPDAPQQRRGST